MRERTPHPQSPLSLLEEEANRLLRIEGLAVAGGAALHLVEVRGEGLGVRRQPAATVPPVDQAAGPTATQRKSVATRRRWGRRKHEHDVEVA